MWRRSAPEEASASPVSVSSRGGGRLRKIRFAPREDISRRSMTHLWRGLVRHAQIQLPILSGGAGDRRAQGPCLLRLRRQLSDRHRSRRDRRRRGDPAIRRAEAGGADDDRQIDPDRRNVLARRFRLRFRTRPLHMPGWQRTGAIPPFYSPEGAASAPMACDFTAPPNWIATWASSSRIAAPARRTKATHERRRRSLVYVVIWNIPWCRWPHLYRSCVRLASRLRAAWRSDLPRVTPLRISPVTSMIDRPSASAFRSIRFATEPFFGTEDISPNFSLNAVSYVENCAYRVSANFMLKCVANAPNGHINCFFTQRQPSRPHMLADIPCLV